MQDPLGAPSLAALSAPAEPSRGVCRQYPTCGPLGNGCVGCVPHRRASFALCRYDWGQIGRLEANQVAASQISQHPINPVKSSPTGLGPGRCFAEICPSRGMAVGGGQGSLQSRRGADKGGHSWGRTTKRCGGWLLCFFFIVVRFSYSGV